MDIINSPSNKVFDNKDLTRKIFTYIPKRCKSCRTIMNPKYTNSSIHQYWDKKWCKTANGFCKGYCNWCCIYVFNHSR